MSAAVAGGTRAEPTIDLAEIAGIGRGDRVRVETFADRTDVLFEETLVLVDAAAPCAPREAPARASSTRARFLPDNDDIRSIYLLAEAVGGYENLQDLVSAHSPGRLLSESFEAKARQVALAPDELRTLTDYQGRIRSALASANAYLREVDLAVCSVEELHGLRDVIRSARERARTLDEIMGLHLGHELERAVARLHEVHAQTRRVERSVSGVFLVDSEVMFIPGEELVRCVEVIFDAVGNAHLARNVDGVLLLAARNLLIEITAFYAYYGKNRIYDLFRHGGSVDPKIVAARIRSEIRRLFETCRRDNRLALTRVMRDAEQRFELSAEVIETEAERAAIAEVERLLPREAPAAPPSRPGLWRRLLGWITGR